MTHSIGCYKAILFLSSDFFSDYFITLTGKKFSPLQKQEINDAIIPLINNMMGQENIFWDIDFSAEKIQLITKELYKAIDKKLFDIKEEISTIVNMYVSDEAYIEHSSMLLGILVRIVRDNEFCLEYKICEELRDSFELCLDETLNNEFDSYDLCKEWESSQNERDIFLKSLTPDLPNYICDNFITVYDAYKAIPNFFNALNKITVNNQYSKNIDKLKDILSRVEEYQYFTVEIEKLIPN